MSDWTGEFTGERRNGQIEIVRREREQRGSRMRKKGDEHDRKGSKAKKKRKIEEDEAGEEMNRGSWERERERENIWDKGCGEVKEGLRVCVWRLGRCDGRYLHSAWSSPMVYLSKASRPGLGPP